ncbi:MAG: hypothetical protein EZS28_018427, partial [Streblomastix strix]
FPTNNISGHISGYIVSVSKVFNLAVVSIDLHKILSDMQKDDIRNKILQEIGGQKKSLGLIQTAHGGLHIYCDLDGYPLQSNSIIKSSKSEKYDIDVFVAIEDSFRGDKTFLCPLRYVLEIVSIGLIEKNEEERRYILSKGIAGIEREHAELLIKKLVGLQVHNDAQPVEKIQRYQRYFPKTESTLVLRDEENEYGGLITKLVLDYVPEPLIQEVMPEASMEEKSKALIEENEQRINEQSTDQSSDPLEILKRIQEEI